MRPDGLGCPDKRREVRTLGIVYRSGDRHNDEVGPHADGTGRVVYSAIPPRIVGLGYVRDCGRYPDRSSRTRPVLMSNATMFCFFPKATAMGSPT